MKATVVGANVPAKTLRAACARADVSGKDVRVVGPRAWVEVPLLASDVHDREGLAHIGAYLFGE